MISLDWIFMSSSRSNPPLSNILSKVRNTLQFSTPGRFDSCNIQYAFDFWCYEFLLVGRKAFIQPTPVFRLQAGLKSLLVVVIEQIMYIYLVLCDYIVKSEEKHAQFFKVCLSTCSPQPDRYPASHQSFNFEILSVNQSWGFLTHIFDLFFVNKRHNSGSTWCGLII